MTIKLEPGENLLNPELKPIPPKFEDLDLSLFSKIGESLETINAPTRERILEALNIIYDALAAPTYVQSYISIYGALSYLITDIGHKEKSRDAAWETFSKFKDSGVLTDEQRDLLMKKFTQIHTKQYGVLKANKVKSEKPDGIGAFFKEFLLKYIEYAKLIHKEER